MLGDLSDRDRAILALEDVWPRHSGAKEERIRAQLGMSPARYYQLLGRLIETEQALEHDPMLVRRLRRMRDARRGRAEGASSAGRIAFTGVQPRA